MASLEGKVALVTGAPGELALAVAAAFAEASAAVALAGRRPPDALPAGVAPLEMDVLDPDGCRAAAERLVERHGRLDALVHLEGLAVAPPPGRPLHEVEEADWDAAVAGTLRSALLVSRAALPAMRAAGGGSIVLTSHAAALVGVPGTSLLAATTGALLNMTRAMAVSSRDDRVRVNCVCLGSSYAPVVPSQLSGLDQPEQERPQRVAPVELAGLFVFLASDAAAHVNGQVIPADDGMSAWR